MNNLVKSWSLGVFSVPTVQHHIVHRVGTILGGRKGMRLLALLARSKPGEEATSGRGKPGE